MARGSPTTGKRVAPTAAGNPPAANAPPRFTQPSSPLTQPEPPAVEPTALGEPGRVRPIPGERNENRNSGGNNLFGGNNGRNMEELPIGEPGVPAFNSTFPAGDTGSNAQIRTQEMTPNETPDPQPQAPAPLPMAAEYRVLGTGHTAQPGVADGSDLLAGADTGGGRTTGRLGRDGVEMGDGPGVKPAGKTLSKPVGNSPKSASLRTPIEVPAFVGKPVGNSLPDAVGISVGKPVGNSVGNTVGKQESGQQKQQVTRTEWFRHELDFRQNKKGGAWVLIRRRLRWSDTRYSKMVVKRFCPQLSKKMIEQISVGKFSQETIAALQDGGIQHGFISALQQRIGKGNGKRRAELTDIERSLLARIESGIRSSGRRRDD